MFDELVKRLREVEEMLKVAQFKEAANLIEQAADAIEKLSKPRWIPVTEQPQFKVGDDCYNGYLVYANGYYEIADYIMDELDGVPYFYVDGEYEAYITHFMPLPEPPEEES